MLPHFTDTFAFPGMIGWPARRRRRHPGKPQGRKVQFVDEDLDYPNRVLLADIIFQAVRKQRPLRVRSSPSMNRCISKPPKPPSSATSTTTHSCPAAEEVKPGDWPLRDFGIADIVIW